MTSCVSKISSAEAVKTWTSSICCAASVSDWTSSACTAVSNNTPRSLGGTAAGAPMALGELNSPYPSALRAATLTLYGTPVFSWSRTMPVAAEPWTTLSTTLARTPSARSVASTLMGGWSPSASSKATDT